MSLENQLVKLYDLGVLNSASSAFSIANARGYIGLPVFAPLVLYDTNNTLVAYFELAVVEVNRTAQIVRTALIGSSSTYKEFVRNDDAVVSVKGALFAEYDKPPYDKMRELNAVFVAGSTLRAESDFLNALGVYEVVVEEWSFAQREGYPNMIPFTFTLLSNEPLEIQERNLLSESFTNTPQNIG